MNIKNIFICYARDDFLTRGIKLRNYLANLFPEIDVYIDQSKTKGQNWKETNYGKLESAQIVIVILTPAALISTEVKNEIEFAKQKSKIIIPCKDDALDMDWTEIPYDLGQLDGIKFELSEILRTKLFTEIKKIVRSQLVQKQIIVEDALKFTDSVLITKKETEGFSIDAILVKEGTIDLRLGEKNFELKFRILEGDVKFLNSTINLDTSSIVLNLETLLDSVVELFVPKDLIDGKSNDSDENFVVLIDETEWDFQETTSDNVRILKLSVPAKSNQIEIIGHKLLPTTTSTTKANLEKVHSSQITEFEITLVFTDDKNENVDNAKKEVRTKSDNWLSIFNDCKKTDPYELSGYGFVRAIVFNDEKIIVSEPNFSESNFGGRLWQSATFRVVTHKLETIEKLAHLGKHPYWNLRWFFSSSLDVNGLITKIQELTGKISPSKGGAQYGSRTIWSSAMYPLTSNDVGTVVVHLGVNQIDLSVFVNAPNTGFYRAHVILTPDLLIRFLLGEINYVEMKKKIDDSLIKI